MTDLAVQLERLGLEQYLDAFIGEGFDNWDTLCDVQESDLEALNIKLGHRRKLQRAIAEYRGISYERLVQVHSPAAQDNTSESARTIEGLQAPVAGREGTSGPPTETKRKYRRHPKADENAPEKPPSAYVLFSNRVREEVKSDNLSFTEIAKLVGDRWQKLDPSQKEPFESQAATLKEQYNLELSTYKKTEAYRDYAQYLNDFKAKHGPQTETKRPKLDPQSSGGSLSGTSVEVVPDSATVATGHGRIGSVSSMSAASLTSAMTSPLGVSIMPTSSLTNIAGTSSRGLPGLPRPGSPQLPPYGQHRLIGQLSTTSSASDDSAQISYDALSRTATLSLSTPPTGTPPLPSHAPGPSRSEQPAMGETLSWSSRAGPSIHQPGSLVTAGPSPRGPGITLPSPTFGGESWRDRSMDWTRQMPTSPLNTTGGPAPSLPLPPLLGSDRMTDMNHATTPRILPPLRHNSASSPASSAFPGASSMTQLPRHTTIDGERRYAQPHEGGSRQLERHENEAASTLAGLATRPGSEAQTPHSRSHDRHRPL